MLLYVCDGEGGGLAVTLVTETDEGAHDIFFKTKTMKKNVLLFFIFYLYSFHRPFRIMPLYKIVQRRRPFVVGVVRF